MVPNWNILNVKWTVNGQFLVLPHNGIYWAIKTNKPLMHARVCLNLKIIMLSKSHTKACSGPGCSSMIRCMLSMYVCGPGFNPQHPKPLKLKAEHTVWECHSYKTVENENKEKLRDILRPGVEGHTTHVQRHLKLEAVTYSLPWISNDFTSSHTC